MDILLQIFKRCISPNTPFFKSFSKKPLETVNDLFKRADKYAMLEKNLLVTSQLVIAIV